MVAVTTARGSVLIANRLGTRLVVVVITYARILTGNCRPTAETGCVRMVITAPEHHVREHRH